MQEMNLMLIGNSILKQLKRTCHEITLDDGTSKSQSIFFKMHNF